MNFLEKLFNSKQMINSFESNDIVQELSDDQLKLVQKKLLEMLLDILTVCEKYRIPIVLGGGSALGAIRHQGFIPWDDDLDLNIPREAYRKFVKIFEEELSDRYILIAPNYKDGSRSRFPKILKKDSYYETISSPADKSLCKLFIDLFIMEFVPEHTLHKRVKGLWVNFLEFVAGLVHFYENNNSTVKELYMRSGKSNYYIRLALGKIFSFRTTASWNNSVDKAVQYNKKSKYVCFPTGRKHYFGEILEYDKLFPITRVMFNGHMVPVFKDYDYYLSNLYGNYMEIPPVEKRERHFVKKIRL